MIYYTIVIDLKSRSPEKREKCKLVKKILIKISQVDGLNNRPGMGNLQSVFRSNKINKKCSSDV